MKTAAKYLLIIGFIIGFTNLSHAQCKSFTKDVCNPKLHPYISNGQLNSAVLNEGDVAELMLTFYSNRDYRIVVCGENQLGQIEFKLKDAAGNVLFSNKDQKMVDFWDFKNKSTQQLMVEVIVPQTTKEGQVHNSGCVSILVGFLDKK